MLNTASIPRTLFLSVAEGFNGTTPTPPDTDHVALGADGSRQRSVKTGNTLCLIGRVVAGVDNT